MKPETTVPIPEIVQPNRAEGDVDLQVFSRFFTGTPTEV